MGFESMAASPFAGIACGTPIDAASLDGKAVDEAVIGGAPIDGGALEAASVEVVVVPEGTFGKAALVEEAVDGSSLDKAF